ncbi:MAG: AAA family ATPase, partial [Fusobacteriaceae bacterium]
MVKKKLPVGVDDFKEIIQNDYYFVDKSMFIDELLNKKSKVTLLPRPRRFGKTLNMSMLNYFFNIEGKDSNKELFDDLDISKTDKMKYLGEYPVIYISLKDIKVNNWELCLEKISALIKKEYKKYGLVLEEKRDAQENSLLNLSEHLYKKYGKKVIILIDEYDTPLVTAYSEGYYKEAIFFFRNFLSAGLKGNPYLELSVLTGILRIAKESIFSGLNNLTVSTILDNDFNYFGLTE